MILLINISDIINNLLQKKIFRQFWYELDRDENVNIVTCVRVTLKTGLSIGNTFTRPLKMTKKAVL